MKIVLLSAVLSAMASAVVALQPEPVEDPGPATATPQPVECPPASRTYRNTSNQDVQVLYECASGDGGATTVESGHSVVFKKDGCSGSGCGPDCTCIDCGLVAQWVDGTQVFSCDVNQHFFTAYGIDLTKLDGPTELPKPVYDRLGNKMQQWAIPIIDESNKLAGWDFTTIEPKFSVDNGEVVIRDLQRRVIGNGRDGITIDD